MWYTLGFSFRESPYQGLWFLGVYGGPKSRWNTQPQAGNSPCEQQKQQICYNAPPAPKINRPCHSCPLLPSPSPCLRHNFHVRDWQKLAQCVLTPTPSPCRGLLVWGLGAGNLESKLMEKENAQLMAISWRICLISCTWL